MQEPKEKGQKTTKEEVIYLAIDHLKKGNYRLDVLLENKVIKSVTIIK
jgi:hypothetical protein